MIPTRAASTAAVTGKRRAGRGADTGGAEGRAGAADDAALSQVGDTAEAAAREGGRPPSGCVRAGLPGAACRRKQRKPEAAGWRGAARLAPCLGLPPCLDQLALWPAVPILPYRTVTYLRCQLTGTAVPAASQPCPARCAASLWLSGQEDLRERILQGAVKKKGGLPASSPADCPAPLVSLPHLPPPLA